MNNLNIDLIKKTLKNNKIFRLSRRQVAALVLAATMVGSVGSVEASAAQVKFDSVTITRDGDIQEGKYTSANLNAKETNTVNTMMESIDRDYQAFVNLMANGLFHDFSLDANGCIARLVATRNEIQAKYELQIKNEKLSTSARNVINRYLETKISIMTAVFTSMNNISADQIKNFEKEYDATLATTIAGTNNTTVVLYKKGNSYAERAVTFNDSVLSKDKALVAIPTVDILDDNSKLTTFIKYQGVIVNANEVATVQQIIKEASVLYDRMEVAANKGNYTKRHSEKIEDIYIALNGDLNLISSSLESKYAQNSEAMNTVRLYMHYRATMITAKVCNGNRSQASYADFVNYANISNPIRSHEGNGYVYYNLGNYGGLYRVSDRGCIKTSELSATGVTVDTVKPNYNNGIVQLTVYTGLNIYYNDNLFRPVDANGNPVDSFVYNGTSYSPVRAVSGICNVGVEWDQATSSVYLTRQGSYIQTPAPYNTTFEKSQLVQKQIQVTTNVRVFIDGVEIIPRDANGQIVPIINWNGTIYLPVRSLVNAIGLPVNYDAENQIVFLGQHYTNNYNQTITPAIPNTPNINVTPGAGTVVGETREYIYGTKDGVEYKIYFDDNGFYLYDGANYVPVNIEEFSFGKTR